MVDEAKVVALIAKLNADRFSYLAHEDTINMLQELLVENRRFRSELLLSRGQFAFYEVQHRNKKTLDGVAKADVNKRHVDRIDAALAGYVTSVAVTVGDETCRYCDPDSIFFQHDPKKFCKHRGAERPVTSGAGVDKSGLSGRK